MISPVDNVCRSISDFNFSPNCMATNNVSTPPLPNMQVNMVPSIRLQGIPANYNYAFSHSPDNNLNMVSKTDQTAFVPMVPMVLPFAGTPPPGQGFGAGTFSQPATPDLQRQPHLTNFGVQQMQQPAFFMYNSDPTGMMYFPYNPYMISPPVTPGPQTPLPVFENNFYAEPAPESDNKSDSANQDDSDSGSTYNDQRGSLSRHHNGYCQSNSQANATVTYDDLSMEQKQYLARFNSSKNKRRSVRSERAYTSRKDSRRDQYDHFQRRRPKKFGYRSKQNKIDEVLHRLQERFEAQGILVPENHGIRGPTVGRVHCKKWRSLSKIEEAFDKVIADERIKTIRVSTPLSMKNKFQKKGFLVYWECETEEQLGYLMQIFKSYDEVDEKGDFIYDEFQKIGVALQTTTAPTTNEEAGASEKENQPEILVGTLV